MSNLLFRYNYNNYYNRIFKRETTPQGYMTGTLGVNYALMSANFNPNDGVNTEHIINSSSIPFTPDYMIIYEGDEVKSRWFVLEEVRTRGGQYKLTLRRDLLADFYTQAISATAYIEKGTPAVYITDGGQSKLNPLLFNSEALDVNQIKKNQTPLKDATGISWLVGYVGKDADFSGSVEQTMSYTITATDHANRWFSIGVSNINEFVPTKIYAASNFKCSTTQKGNYYVKYTMTGTTSCKFEWDASADGNFREGREITIWYYCDAHQCNATYYITNLEGKLVPKNITVMIPSAVQHCEDATYDMFCIPYDPTNTVTNYRRYTDSEETVHYQAENNQSGIAIATALGSKYGDYFYGLMLLPYCPMRHLFTVEGGITYMDADKAYSREYAEVTTDAGDHTTTVYYCKSSQLDFTISTSITMPSTAIDIKVAEGTKKWRLNAPNWSAMYDFSPYKNNGVTELKIKANYKPSSSYINIKPNFSTVGLYGDNYQDARGLVITGEFQISYTKDQYDTYVTQNKYFQQIFNRQIANMETNNALTRQQARTQAIAGTLQGAVSGAVAGSNIGGGGFGVAGAAAGGVLSASAGTADMVVLRKQQEEALDYTKDQFNYSLQTMMAQPDTLVGVDAINKSNTLFPTLEEYGCSAIEETAFRNKLTYNGCTLMVIGTISDYIRSTTSYIKGQFIRLEGLGEDTHLLVELATEFQKGWFI